MPPDADTNAADPADLSPDGLTCIRLALRINDIHADYDNLVRDRPEEILHRRVFESLWTARKHLWDIARAYIEHHDIERRTAAERQGGTDVA